MDLYGNLKMKQIKQINTAERYTAEIIKLVEKQS